MIHFILALGVCLAFTLAAWAVPFNANDTSNASFAGVSAVTGYKISSDDIVINVGTDGPDTVTVKCGSTTKLGPYYLAANSGVHLFKTNGEPVVKCAVSEALNFVKGVAGSDVTVSGDYSTRK